MGFFMQLRLVVCILLVVFCFKANAAVNLPPNVSIPAVFAFGDSIVDTGNNNNLPLFTIYKGNFPPYGDDFPGRIPTGRFSNGKVPSDILVQELGIKDLLPAYTDPNLNPNELPTGVSFASGGGGYDPVTSKLAHVYSLSTQLDFFKEYIQKLRGLVGDDKTNFILANSLFLVVSGTNDISTTFYSIHPPISIIIDVQFRIYATFLVKSASAFLKEIYELGARRIAVFGAPPIGCLPFQRTIHGLFRNCVGYINDASLYFNDMLSAEINSLEQSLTNGKISYIDIYNPLMAIINGTDHDGGFNVVDKGCCGTGYVEASYLCNHLVSMCPNHTEYMFWDSFHPTEALYKYILPPALQKYIDENLK